jgi:predicted metal-dependent HD superfamily phosphohydrolase
MFYEHSQQFFLLLEKLSGVLSANAATIYSELQAAYQQSHRHYHTLQHITECLQLFDEYQHLAEQPLAVKFALWFHDAVYQPQCFDNEQQSAKWALEVLQQGQVLETVQRQIYDLIMATAHQQPPKTHDEKLIVDVDLAILAALPARFAEYERQIRAEYDWVVEAVYQQKRKEILTQLYNNGDIYHLPELKNALEISAHANLQRVLTGSC